MADHDDLYEAIRDYQAAHGPLDLMLFVIVQDEEWSDQLLRLVNNALREGRALTEEELAPFHVEVPPDHIHI